MGASDALIERLFVAYFTEGVDIGQIDNLVEIAKQSGMKPDHTRKWLKSSGGSSRSWPKPVSYEKRNQWRALFYF